MNISKVKINKILGIDRMEIKPGQFNLISGENGAGKTSILKALGLALKGGTNAEIIRKGSKKGEVVIEFDDGMNLVRTLTQKGQTLVVTDQKGKKVGKPQAKLNDLADMLSVNPVTFMSDNKKIRLKTLLEALPLRIKQEDVIGIIENVDVSFDDLDYNSHAIEVLNHIYKETFQERTNINRELIKSKRTVETISELVDDDDLTEIKDRYDILNTQLLSAKTNHVTKLKNLTDTKDMKHKELLATYNQRVREIDSAYNSHKELIVDEYNVKNKEAEIEIAELQVKIDKSEKAEATKKQISHLENEIETLSESSEKHTEALISIEDKKSEMLKEIPIPGLTVQDGDIFVDDVSFDQLNTAKQIQISVEIAKLRIGDLGIMCMDGLEKLDKEAFDHFHKVTNQANLQLFVTKVSNEGLKVETK